MNTKELRIALDKLDSARSSLKRAIEAREALNLRGHQSELSVNIGDTRIVVTYNDHTTGWASRCERGCEMILLGMQKVANVKVDEYRARVAFLEEEVVKRTGAAS